MNRHKKFLLAAALIAGLVILVAGIVLLKTTPPPAAPSAAPQPARMIAKNPRNVVLVVIDALRGDRLHAERNAIPLMPHLMDLAKKSIEFTHANATCTWTRPSMASILTSLYVDTHKVYYQGNPSNPGDPKASVLSKSFENMASYLKRAGFMTAAVQQNGNLCRELGFAEGFDVFDFFKNEMMADELTSKALERLPSLKEPFFFYVHYMDPHAPYMPPQKYREMFGWPPAITQKELDIVENKMENSKSGQFIDYLVDHCEFMTGVKNQRSFEPLSDAAKEASRLLYDGETKFADDEVSKLLDAVLKDHPNSIIVVLADHGEHLWDHGHMGHGLTMYEEELRVPFIIYDPDRAPQAIDTEVSTVSMLPTIAALLGLPPNPAWQGHDLLAANAGKEPDTVYSHTYAPYPYLNTEVEAVKQGNLKLIADRKKNSDLLFDMPNDPGEKNDLASTRANDVAALDKLLGAHKAANVKAGSHVKEQTAAMSAEVQEQLNKLGYKAGARNGAEQKAHEPAP